MLREFALQSHWDLLPEIDAIQKKLEDIRLQMTRKQTTLDTFFHHNWYWRFFHHLNMNKYMYIYIEVFSPSEVYLPKERSYISSEPVWVEVSDRNLLCRWQYNSGNRIPPISENTSFKRKNWAVTIFFAHRRDNCIWEPEKRKTHRRPCPECSRLWDQR